MCIIIHIIIIHVVLLFVVKKYVRRHKIFKDVNFYSQKNLCAMISVQNMQVVRKTYCTIVI